MNEPITCFGDELLTVCADLRAHGAVIESLDAMVVKPSGYRVHYFEREPVLAPALAARQCVDGRISPAGENPAALTKSPHQTKSPAGDIAPPVVKSEVAPRDQLNDPKIPCYGPARAESAETVGCGDSIQDRLSALQSRLAASGKLKPSTRTKQNVRLPYKD